MFASVKLTVMIEDLVAPLRAADIEIAVDAHATHGKGAAHPANPSSGAIRRLPMGSAIFSRMPSILPKTRSRSRRAGRMATSPSRSATTVRALPRRSSTGWAIPSSPRGPAMARAERTMTPTAMTAWGSASSSPRPCWSARVPPCHWPTGRPRITARWSRLSGRAPSSMSEQLAGQSPRLEHGEQVSNRLRPTYKTTNSTSGPLGDQ